MPARREEVRHAREEGVRFEFLTAPVELLGDAEGRLRGIRLRRMELSEPDESGRRKPVPIPGSEFEVPSEVAIVAIGNDPNPMIRRTDHSIAHTRRGTIEADPITGKTSRRGVFAGGDIVTGGATVILAMGAGRRAAAAIDEYLRTGEWEPGERLPLSPPPDGGYGRVMTEQQPPIEVARQIRREIKEAMRLLEEALARPTHVPGWHDQVGTRVGELEEALASHVAELEAPGGLHAEILETAPRLARTVEELATDHDAIEAELAVAKTGLGGDPEWLRERFMALLAHVARHRQKGADLVYDALNADIGGPGPG
jgi:hypothetical protein